MFYLSKFVSVLIDPANFFACLALFALAALILPWRRAKRIGRTVLVVQAVLLSLVTLLPAGQWMLVPLETRFAAPERLPPDLSGVIVLGGSIEPGLSRVHGRLQVNASAERLLALREIADRIPDVPVVFTGGSGSVLSPGEREATALVNGLSELGLSRDRLMIENDSRNTWENSVYSRHMLGSRAEGRWLLVTSAWHMPRAVGVFRESGWNVAPFPVDYRTDGSSPWLTPPYGKRNLVDAAIGVREWVGLVSYFAMGRSVEIFPAPLEAPTKSDNTAAKRG